MNKQELIKYFEDLPYVSITQMGKKSFIDLIEQLDEPQKVTVPQFVAEYIKKTKNYHWDLHEAMQWVELEDCKELKEYFYIAKNIETFARAWLDGYTVKEEKRYIVSLKNGQPLVKSQSGSTLYFSQDITAGNYKVTRKELEDAGFGEVFNSTLFEVEEVGE
jgi:phage protein|nr:MAG TPA: Protein of unknown function (DUF1642) [Caudoviricetes sp.]